jgi:hypothetical protein
LRYQLRPKTYAQQGCSIPDRSPDKALFFDQVAVIIVNRHGASQYDYAGETFDIDRNDILLCID